MELRHGFRNRLSKLLLDYLLLLLCISSLPVHDGKTLTVQHLARSKRSQIIELSQFLDGESGQPLTLERKKREVTTIANSSISERQIAAPNVTYLPDSHNQLVVYWAGLDVIICLARDSKSGSSSALHISNDYGSNFEDVSTKLLIDKENATSFPTLDKFFNHPKNNGHFLFTDVRNKLIFTTTNYGGDFLKLRLDFTPDEVSFDPNSDQTIVIFETSTVARGLYVSLDFGVTWKLVEESVKSIAWDESVVPTSLYVGRAEPNNLVTLLSSTSLFLDADSKQIVLTGIEEFDLKEEYIFATRRKANDLQLLVSYKRGNFVETMFPAEYPSQHFHIADVSNGQMFVCVTHNETVTNLYIGNEPADILEPAKFSLSLERIVFFKPNLTWSGSWLNDVTDEPFVELHHIEGLRGVYIASQFKSSAVSTTKFGLDQIHTVITFDQGGIWGPLDTPDVDNDGEPVYCKLAANFTKVNCSLHISQRLSELYPQTRAVPILSQKSAIGLVMATGTVDNSLKGHLGVYMSTDGAAHWKQILQGNYLYNFGDHGGLIVAVKYYKLGDLTNTLIYSTDEGTSWKTFKFYEKEIRVLGLMTEPGENTTVFFIFGSDNRNSKHSWVLIKVDLRNAFDGPCDEDDYKDWSPSDAQPGARHCLLGRTDFFERRRPNVSCYNGAPYIRTVRTKPCLCKRIDFECDFGYKELEGDPKVRCVKDTSDTSMGVKSEWCKPGDLYYNRTKGYRKIPGDTCEFGESETYLPKTIQCALRNESEFMIVAKRDSVLRIDLNDFTHVEVLPLGNVRAVVAIDFDLKNNCIYWSDVNKDQIMRLHLDGMSSPELLVSADLKSVEGIAFDWMARNLYFVDGTLKKIEVIKTDVSILGRLRKQILGPSYLDKPRGIAVHPAKGFLFWTDWSTTAPYIGRSGLDGSNPQRIIKNEDESAVSKTVKWPNGIAVDVVRDLIYWVDANTDTIYMADLDGKNLKSFVSDDPGVSHPFAVGVYNNFVYWDDWTTRSIYTARTDTVNPKEGIIKIQDNLSRLMDLKVYGLKSQTGINQCSGSNSTCKHLCLAGPNETAAACQCPDGLSMTNGECLCPDGKPVDNGFCASNCNYTAAFHCKSGFCILPRWRCDGQPDCGPGDASDEENCDSESTCADNQFRCVADGKCIPIHWACDLDVDCESDGSDEIGCAYSNACNSADHFQCNNRQCISNKWLCDGEDDCGDNSDEKNCTTPLPNTCKLDEFQCADKRCLSIAWVCDGDIDCLDGSDEKNCTGNKCPDWKYQCNSGECIRKSWRCDDDFDCADHSDEANCTSSGAIIPPEPPAGSMFGNCSDMDQMFQCAGADALCVPIFWVNDGIKDCPEGDDELDEDEDASESPNVTLRPAVKTCPDNHFQCMSTGECIYESKFCDGITDCPDGSDEKSCDSVFERDCPKGYVKCGLSSICIRLEKLRDGVTDCPNGFDSDFGNETIIRSACNPGQFLCDEDICLPLYQRCDGTANCIDGTDESAEICKNHKPVYQVAGISVEQLEGHGSFVEWWLPSSATGPLEFLTSYCEVVTNICHNSTWIKQRRYEISSDATKPFTNYSVTVFVRKSDQVYRPAIYTHFLTLEGGSTPPYNITVYQPDVNNLCIRWNRPLNPNGKITQYSVYFTPPTPPASVISLGEKFCISNNRVNPELIPGTNYSFWVTATNGFNTTLPSKVVSYVFHDDVAEVISASVKASSESLVTLEWAVTTKSVTEYEITYENQGGMYHFSTKLVSKTNRTTIELLPPGTKFKYVIVPVHNKMYGAPYKGFFATKGKPLPGVEGLKLSVSKTNVISATWTAVVDDRSKSWEYMVLYGKSLREIATQRLQVKTKKTTANVNQLEACENYFITVGVIGPNGGIGPMSPQKKVMTSMDVKAPPKNLEIVAGLANGTVIFNWDAPCPILEQEIGYNLNFREVNLNHTFVSTDVTVSKLAKLKFSVVAPYGGRYEVTVTTNVKDARPSQPVLFEGIPIPPPKMLHQCLACNAPTIYWEPPELPTPVLQKGNVTYVVWVSEDETFSNAKPFLTSDSSFKLDGIESEHVYYVAVSVKDSDGLESSLSEHIPLQYLDTTPTGQISMSESNLVGIVATVIIVISLLVAALGVFFVRHRRLQVSFLNFASSHYSTSSGAAIFQQSVEEEMDSPVIRGFSDDEPLLVA